MKTAAIFVIVCLCMIQSAFSFGLNSIRRSSGLLKATKSRTPFKSSTSLHATTIAGPEKLTKSTAGTKLLEKTDCFIFDCDGVIWKGDSVIPGIPETLAKLREAGKKIFFVTNNSTKSRKGYLGKFKSLGLDVEAEEIFSSSFAAAAYLEQNPLPAGKKAYVIGQIGIPEELDLLKIPHFGGPDDSDKVLT